MKRFHLQNNWYAFLDVLIVSYLFIDYDWRFQNARVWKINLYKNCFTNCFYKNENHDFVQFQLFLFNISILWFFFTFNFFKNHFSNVMFLFFFKTTIYVLILFLKSSKIVLINTFEKFKSFFFFANSNQSIVFNNFRFVDFVVVIELFNQKRRDHVQLLNFEKQIFFAQKFESNWKFDQITRRRMFYIRENKFDIINYVFIVKNRVNKFINRYMTSKKLNITIQMFKNWINKQHDIEINKKNTRKIKFICHDRKFIMKNEFIEFFIEIKNRNRRINKR